MAPHLKNQWDEWHYSLVSVQLTIAISPPSAAMAKVEQKGEGNQQEIHEPSNSAGLGLICGTTPNNNLVIHSILS